MCLRSTRERIIQTLAYEAFALVIFVPLYTAYAGKQATDGFLVIAALTVAAICWSPLHNTVFDVLDLRFSGRVASDRPQVWRVVHALSHEFTQIVVSVPLLMWLGGHGLMEAILVDIGLTIGYTIYAWGFHLAFDAVRPVGYGAPAAPVPAPRPQ
jgi:uncharacterized membrane protein